VCSVSPFCGSRTNFPPTPNIHIGNVQETPQNLLVFQTLWHSVRTVKPIFIISSFIYKVSSFLPTVLFLFHSIFYLYYPQAILFLFSHHYHHHHHHHTIIIITIYSFIKNSTLSIDKMHTITGQKGTNCSNNCPNG